MLRAPGRARDIKRSSPSTLCHFFMLVRRLEFGIPSKISHNRVTRWGGRCIVKLMVSITHPKTSFMVS